jgi:hypothetical protein
MTFSTKYHARCDDCKTILSVWKMPQGHVHKWKSVCPNCLNSDGLPKHKRWLTNSHVAALIKSNAKIDIVMDNC